MEYDFTLRFAVSEEDSDLGALVERLAEAGCDDATVGIGRPGRVALDFTREAASAKEAMLSALADVKRAAPGAVLVEVGPDFVGISDVASRSQSAGDSQGDSRTRRAFRRHCTMEARPYGASYTSSTGFGCAMPTRSARRSATLPTPRCSSTSHRRPVGSGPGFERNCVKPCDRRLAFTCPTMTDATPPSYFANFVNRTDPARKPYGNYADGTAAYCEVLRVARAGAWRASASNPPPTPTPIIDRPGKQGKGHRSGGLSVSAGTAPDQMRFRRGCHTDAAASSPARISSVHSFSVGIAGLTAALYEIVTWPLPLLRAAVVEAFCSPAMYDDPPPAPAA